MSFLILLLLFAAQAVSGQGVGPADYVRLTPGSLPSLCRKGDLRVNASGVVQICNPANTWTGLVAASIPISVANGGTGLSSGTSGGVLGFTASGTLASSVALTANQLVVGGGAGATPTPLGSLGTTTTLLHGNAGGAPTFAAVALGTDVTGQLPVANGGTGLASGTSGGILGYTASGTLASSGALTANQLLVGGGAGATPSALAAGSQYQVLTMGAANPGYGQVALNQSAAITGTLPIGNGGTGVASVTTAPTASSFAGWDANSNLSAVNHLEGYTTTATAAGTSVLTVASNYIQFFTGSTTQTVTLPVVTTLVNGQQYSITNLSSGIVTVQTSGSNTIQAMGTNTQLMLTVKDKTAGTGTASWSWSYGSLIAANLTNPMTTTGDIIYSSDNSGTATRLAVGASSTYLGGGSTPSYKSFTAHAVIAKTSTGTQTGTKFTITSGSATAGATYTNNAHTYTVIKTISSQTTLYTSGTGATSGSTLTKASGTGDASITFSASANLASYTPTSTAKALWVRTVGGGGGGGGTASSASTSGGGAGGGGGGYAEKLITSFDATIYYEVGAAGAAGTAGNNAGGPGGQTTIVDSQNLVFATGGAGGGGGAATSGGSFSSLPIGSGGTGSGGDLNASGDAGTQGFVLTTATQATSGKGGSSMLGGGGAANTNGTAAGVVGTGYGGGGSGGSQLNNGGAQTGGLGTAGVAIFHELFNGN